MRMWTCDGCQSREPHLPSRGRSVSSYTVASPRNYTTAQSPMGRVSAGPHAKAQG